MTMETLYTVNEVAEILQLRPNTVRDLIRKDRVKAYKIGRSYRVKESDLKEYIDSQIKK